jgi:Tetracyclin repressor-like, C-terminal domain
MRAFARIANSHSARAGDVTAVAGELPPCSAKSGPRPENARARRAAAPPWKEALVGALIEKHVDDLTSLCLAELTRVASLPVGEAIRSVVELMIRTHAMNPELHRVLSERVPRVGRMAKLREIEALVHRMVAGLLASRRAELAIDDPDLAAFVLVSAIEAITYRAALLFPELLRDPRLVDETCTMVRRYLGVADG